MENLHTNTRPWAMSLKGTISSILNRFDFHTPLDQFIRIDSDG
jgi:hypothetical protein